MSQVQRSYKCAECRRRRVKCDGARPSCAKCGKKGCPCPGYDILEMKIKGYSKRNVQRLLPEALQRHVQVTAACQKDTADAQPASPPATPLSSCRTFSSCSNTSVTTPPPPLPRGIKALYEPENTSSGVCTTTINDQQPRFFQTARQAPARFFRSPCSATFYYCLYPLCTWKFRDEASLECHMKVHFEQDPLIVPDYGYAETDYMYDGEINQCSPSRENRALPWETNKALNLLLPSHSPTWLTEDYSGIPEWASNIRSCGGPQPTKGEIVSSSLPYLRGIDSSPEWPWSGPSYTNRRGPFTDYIFYLNSKRGISLESIKTIEDEEGLELSTDELATADLRGFVKEELVDEDLISTSIADDEGFCSQRPQTEDYEYRRYLNEDLALQSLYSASNTYGEPPDPTLPPYCPTMMELSPYPRKAQSCPIPKCGRLEKLDHQNRHKTQNERPNSDLSGTAGILDAYHRFERPLKEAQDHAFQCPVKAETVKRQLNPEDDSALNKKRRKKFREDPESPAARCSSSVQPEEKLGNYTICTAAQAKDQANDIAKLESVAPIGLKHEPKTATPISKPFPKPVSLICELSPDQVKHGKTLPLPFGHPKSRGWKQALPSIKACTRAVLGKGNGGVIELFCVDKEPTICITCWDPSKVNHDILTACMMSLDLPIVITKGTIKKSTGDFSPENFAFSGDGRHVEARPPMHGHYMRRPACGASLGISEGPLRGWNVSLGGYLKVKPINRAEWVTYAMTVHHVLVDDRQDRQPSQENCGDEDEDMIELGYDYAPGVCDGILSGAADCTPRITFSSPAVPDLTDLISRLEARLMKSRSNEEYARIDDVDKSESLLKELCNSHCTNFGSAAWSSGLTIAEDVEMDWLLIGEIPTQRIGRNNSGDIGAFMESSCEDFDASPHNWTPSSYVDETAFASMMDFTGRDWDEEDPSEYGYLSRVFGRGSESGLADGFLSPNSSIFSDPDLGEYDGWAFSPRYATGLGYPGDSGSWIYTSEGKLLGQITSYNRERHITYFTPICKVFKHIKHVIGATDVELLAPEDVPAPSDAAQRAPYGLMSPEGGSPEALRQMARAPGEGKMHTPPTPAKTPSWSPLPMNSSFPE